MPCSIDTTPRACPRRGEATALPNGIAVSSRARSRARRALESNPPHGVLELGLARPHPPDALHQDPTHAGVFLSVPAAGRSPPPPSSCGACSNTFAYAPWSPLAGSRDVCTCMHACIAQPVVTRIAALPCYTREQCCIVREGTAFIKTRLLACTRSCTARCRSFCSVAKHAANITDGCAQTRGCVCQMHLDVKSYAAGRCKGPTSGGKRLSVVQRGGYCTHMAMCTSAQRPQSCSHDAYC